MQNTNDSQPEMANQVCIVTGSNTGIGKAAACEFAKKGAHVILACRSEEKTLPVVDEIKKVTNNEHVEFMKLDLASFASIRQFAENFLSKGLPLHVLVNNASLYNVEGETEDGLEMILGVSHFGHFLLTNLLLPKIQESAPSKIINVSSDAAWVTKKFDFTDLKGENSKGSFGFMLYSRAKLANVLFTVELNRRLNVPKFSGVSVNAVHPGMVKTEITRNAHWIVKLLNPVAQFLVGRTPEQGADTIVYLTTKEAEGLTGQYFVDRKSRPIQPQGSDPEDCLKLWDLSIQITGLASQQ